MSSCSAEDDAYCFVIMQAVQCLTLHEAGRGCNFMLCLSVACAALSVSSVSSFAAARLQLLFSNFFKMRVVKVRTSVVRDDQWSLVYVGLT